MNLHQVANLNTVANVKSGSTLRRAIGTSVLFAAATVGVTSFGFARADVQYTTQMSMPQNGKMVPFSTMTTYQKAGLQRTDSQTNLGMYKTSESTVTRCAKKDVLTFDPSLKIYALQTISAYRNGGASTSAGSGGASGTGKMIMTANVKLINREKIAGRMTRHYRITQRLQSSGCCGTNDMTTNSEIWVADVALPAFACASDPTDMSQGFRSGNCKITYERRGDTRALAAAYKGLLMKSINRDASGKVVSQMQITKLSFANLSAGLFNAPTGYSKVSKADYDKKRQEAMIAAMSNNG